MHGLLFQYRDHTCAITLRPLIYSIPMKSVLVAGGTDGIGLAFVKLLDSKQYRTVFILGRNFSHISEIEWPNIVELSCDITDHDSLAAAIAKIDQPLDQFVNTIGTFYRGPAEKASPAEVARHFEVNAVGSSPLSS